MAVSDASDLRAALGYDPSTGVFTWLQPPRCGRSYVGQAAGSIAGKGYRYIKHAGANYRASRLAWLFVHGGWPPDGLQLDHINGDRADDRIANLRLATSSQNAANRGTHVTNKLGLKGVRFYAKKRRYIVNITVGGRRKYLGSYQTAQEASAVYALAARRLHGEFARAA